VSLTTGVSDLKVVRGILMPLPRRDRSRIRNACPIEKPIFTKAEIITPKKRKLSPKVTKMIKNRRNVMLKGM